MGSAKHPTGTSTSTDDSHRVNCHQAVLSGQHWHSARTFGRPRDGCTGFAADAVCTCRLPLPRSAQTAARRRKDAQSGEIRTTVATAPTDTEDLERELLRQGVGALAADR